LIRPRIRNQKKAIRGRLTMAFRFSVIARVNVKLKLATRDRKTPTRGLIRWSPNLAKTALLAKPNAANRASNTASI
jgi:hypothetical protein